LVEKALLWRILCVDAYGKAVNLDIFAQKSAQSNLQALLACAHTESAHMNSALIFFIVILFHIYYNWKVIVRYIKKKADMAINLKIELLAVILLVSTQ